MENEVCFSLVREAYELMLSSTILWPSFGMSRKTSVNSWNTRVIYLLIKYMKTFLDSYWRREFAYSFFEKVVFICDVYDKGSNLLKGP